MLMMVGVCLGHGQTQMQISIKDLPTYNLRLVPPSDPTFEQRFEAILQNSKNEPMFNIGSFLLF